MSKYPLCLFAGNIPRELHLMVSVTVCIVFISCGLYPRLTRAGNTNATPCDHALLKDDSLSLCYQMEGINAADIVWLRTLAGKGNADADFALGELYLYGVGVHGNLVEAVKWYQNGAEKGNVNAKKALQLVEFRLGTNYLTGTGEPRDIVKGLYWIRKEAEAGDGSGAFLVANSYLNGDPSIGIQKDYAKAVEWYRIDEKAEGNVTDEYMLGEAYYLGRGVQRDYAQAFAWYSKAAARGDADSEYNLAVMYANGRGVPVNPAAAADCFYKAGIEYLKSGKRDEALLDAELIDGLQNKYGDLPNAFLAKKLTAQIYAPPAASNPKPASQSTIREGTGWPVAGGFVVTNHHVIAGAQTIWIITAAGAKLQATIAADDVNNDLVLLKVQNPSMLPPALPIAPNPAAVGESVFALGYPHPDLMGSDVKLTDGIISAMAGPGDDPRLYQISAQVQSGNSGGPLLDMDGEVVGIVSAKLDAAKVFKLTGDLPENVNYAIKASYLTAFLQSANPIGKMPVLAGNHASLEALDKRIAPSVVMILAIPPESGNSSTAPQ